MIRRFFSRRSVQVSITVVLSALFLYLVFRSFSWTEFLNAIVQFDLRWLAPGIGLAVIWYAVRALRWQVILQPVQNVPLYFLFQAMILGFFVNMVLPINAGEVVRAYLVKRDHGVSMFTIFGSYAVERVYGLLAFWLVGLVAALAIALPPDAAQVRQRVLLGLAVGLVGLAALGLLLFWLYRRQPSMAWLGRSLARRVPPVGKCNWLAVGSAFARAFNLAAHGAPRP